MKRQAARMVKLIKNAIKKDMVSGRKEYKVDIIHVSSLYNLCIERIRLAKETGMGYDPPRKLDLARAFTFKQGRYLQSMVVDSIMKEYPECVLSRWICPDCFHVEIDIGQDKLCPKCKAHMKPNEINLEYKIPNTEFKIVGNIDLCLGINNKFIPVEVKGLRKEDFEKSYPIYRYHYQLSCYLWLIKNADGVDERLSSDYGILLYLSKQHTQVPIKGFLVTPDKSKLIWEEIEQYIENLKTFSKTGQSIKLCKSKASSTFRDCPYKKLCWR